VLRSVLFGKYCRSRPLDALCLSSRLAERVRRVRGDGGGLNEAVETAGKNALQTPANVAVGLAFGAASCFVVAGIFMAAEPGDRNGVQGAVEVSVAHSAEPVPGALAAAGFEWGDAGESGERCFVANASAMGPADQELGGDDRSDTGSASNAGPAGCCGMRTSSSTSSSAAWLIKNPDTSGDRAKRSDRDPMLGRQDVSRGDGGDRCST
jgi:hypothetical protein